MNWGRIWYKGHGYVETHNLEATYTKPNMCDVAFDLLLVYQDWR